MMPAQTTPSGTGISECYWTDPAHVDSHELELSEDLGAVPDTDWYLRLRAAIRGKSFHNVGQEHMILYEAKITGTHFLRGIVDAAAADSSVSQGERPKEAYVHVGPLIHAGLLSGAMGVMEGTQDTLVHRPYRARSEPMSAFVLIPEELREGFDHGLNWMGDSSGAARTYSLERAGKRFADILLHQEGVDRDTPTTGMIEAARSAEFYRKRVVRPSRIRRHRWSATDESKTSRRSAAQSLSAIVELTAKDQDYQSLIDYLEWQIELGTERGDSPLDAFKKVRSELQDQARLRAEARKTIQQEDMYSERQAAVALGAEETDLSEVEALRGRSWLIGLPSRDGYRYPTFQFDRAQMDVYEVVRTVNVLLGARDDPWSAASWWLFPNDRLGNCPANLVVLSQVAAPSDPLRKHPAEDDAKYWADHLIAAAKAVTDPVG